MTDQNAIPAGRELDALVAERVFGCVVSTTYPDTVLRIPVCTRHDTHRSIPAYSTYIAAAWDVLARIAEVSQYVVTLRGPYHHADAGHPPVWDIEFYADGEFHRWRSEPSAPVAICRAALKVVGVGVGERKGHPVGGGEDNT